MTFRELKEDLNKLSEEQLDKTVSLYDYCGQYLSTGIGFRMWPHEKIEHLFEDKNTPHFTFSF